MLCYTQSLWKIWSILPTQPSYVRPGTTERVCHSGEFRQHLPYLITTATTLPLGPVVAYLASFVNTILPCDVMLHRIIMEDLVNPANPTELCKTRHYRESLPICGMIINS
jgi:hypothetical protein